MQTTEAVNSDSTVGQHEELVQEWKETLRRRGNILLNDLKSGIVAKNAREIESASRTIADMAIKADCQEVFRIALSLETMGAHHELDGSEDLFILISHELERLRLSLVKRQRSLEKYVKLAEK